MSDRELLLKTAEISLREAPEGQVVAAVAPVVVDGRVVHPNLHADGTWRGRAERGDLQEDVRRRIRVGWC